jgi:hypothetical protein
MIRRAWEVEYTDEFMQWWMSLDRREQEAIGSKVDLLVEEGTALGFPFSSQIKSSRHGRLRELRVQRAGRPLRVLYAFDPRRFVILLIGGDKTGDARFYQRIVAIADRLYDEHLDALKSEGLI